MFHQKLESYRFRLALKKLGWLQVEIKCHNLKCVDFEKKGAKDKNIAILFFMSTFHNFAHEIKTGWAAMVIKPILKTTNVDDQC